MTEERKPLTAKAFKVSFAGEANLPVHYVNIVNIRGGMEEFFVTLGTAVPPEVIDVNDLEHIDLDGHPLFRFAVSRSVMKQMIDLMGKIYEVQSEQLALLQEKQRIERQEEG